MSAFAYMVNLLVVELPPTITTIEGSFTSCENLTSINLPEGLLTIGNNAFSSCESLSLQSLPSTLTSLGQAAF
jgi:hypothetical protein